LSNDFLKAVVPEVERALVSDEQPDEGETDPYLKKFMSWKATTSKGREVELAALKGAKVKVDHDGAATVVSNLCFAVFVVVCSEGRCVLQADSAGHGDVAVTGTSDDGDAKTAPSRSSGKRATLTGLGNIKLTGGKGKEERKKRKAMKGSAAVVEGVYFSVCGRIGVDCLCVQKLTLMQYRQQVAVAVMVTVKATVPVSLSCQCQGTLERRRGNPRKQSIRSEMACVCVCTVLMCDACSETRKWIMMVTHH
jgi:hypothetical protein